MQTIKPAKNQIFARPVEEVNQTKTGLFIPDGKGEKPQMAEVINVGSGVTQFKPKDKIVYKLFTTTDIKLDRVDYILIEELDVLGTVVDV